MKLKGTVKSFRKYDFSFSNLMPKDIFRLLFWNKSWVGPKGEYVIMEKTHGGGLTTKRADAFMPITYFNHVINDGIAMQSSDKHYASTPHTIDVTWSAVTEKCTVSAKVKKKQVHATNWQTPPTPPKMMPE